MIITDIKTAELIKYTSNAFLATKISFINEIANLCENIGCDVHTVARSMGLDRRIGPKFLHPGPGYGGSCFPKDTLALLEIGKDNSIDLNIVKATIQVNKRQRERMMDKITHVMGELKDKIIAVLGLSFKPNTDDIREAPSLYLIEKMLAMGAVVRTFDPVAMSNVKKVFPHIAYCENAYEAAQGADALVIVTEWNQLRSLDLKQLKNLLKGDYFFDLRNIYEPDKPKKAGFRYFAVGRA
jgi:UDPglucose 6-dehydrogenase